ncbi:hypothetical protein PRIPAC_75006 [Pristionchus pacificus]|uniref:Uncharacterized protein n=1 Tax=Pristionchus pacificus TaxID=54126 RepID=A0A2A6C7B4_PRIPA|nr:hypothetical protein PRIPAC_75006 [Pristionchus pacificus]|eukprot:PDM74059.1 hypothetical protein PRIPAC_41415 [Pristionchus pacificus]
MACAQLQRIDEIESWRQKAFTLSRTDRIGRLIAKTFDIIQIIVRDGPNTEILMYEAESMKAEHASAMNVDPNRNDILRCLFYGLSSSIGSMIESIQERTKEQEDIQEQQIALDYSDGSLLEDNNMNQVQRDGNAYKNKEYFQDNQGCPAQAAKIEPVEFQQDFSLDEAAIFDLKDLKSEPPTDENETDDNVLENSTAKATIPINITDDIVNAASVDTNQDGNEDEIQASRSAHLFFYHG